MSLEELLVSHSLSHRHNTLCTHLVFCWAIVHCEVFGIWCCWSSTKALSKKVAKGHRMQILYISPLSMYLGYWPSGFHLQITRSKIKLRISRQYRNTLEQVQGLPGLQAPCNYINCTPIEPELISKWDGVFMSYDLLSWAHVVSLLGQPHFSKFCFIFSPLLF